MLFLSSYLSKYLTKLDVHDDNNSIVIENGMQIGLGCKFNFDIHTDTSYTIVRLWVFKLKNT